MSVPSPVQLDPIPATVPSSEPTLTIGQFQFMTFTDSTPGISPEQIASLLRVLSPLQSYIIEENNSSGEHAHLHAIVLGDAPIVKAYVKASKVFGSRPLCRPHFDLKTQKDPSQIANIVRGYLQKDPKRKIHRDTLSPDVWTVLNQFSMDPTHAYKTSRTKTSGKSANYVNNETFPDLIIAKGLEFKLDPYMETTEILMRMAQQKTKYPMMALLKHMKLCREVIGLKLGLNTGDVGTIINYHQSLRQQ